MATREKILLVDDDVDLVETLGLVLENRGYVVVAAHDAQTGLTKADVERPDLILLDVMMPDSTEGFRFVWALRERGEPYFQNVPIIMLTAIQRETGLSFYPVGAGGTARGGEHLQVQGFLDKPIDPAQLLESVQAALTAAWRKG